MGWDVHCTQSPLKTPAVHLKQGIQRYKINTKTLFKYFHHQHFAWTLKTVRVHRWMKRALKLKPRPIKFPLAFQKTPQNLINFKTLQNLIDFKTLQNLIDFEEYSSSGQCSKLGENEERSSDKRSRLFREGVVFFGGKIPICKLMCRLRAGLLLKDFPHCSHWKLTSCFWFISRVWLWVVNSEIILLLPLFCEGISIDDYHPKCTMGIIQTPINFGSDPLAINL